ncbi:TonB-dependent receptor [Pseudoduganella sp. OTU4001]|uniref:TonB-dependent receptor n=1 Tax=Pseudoduganella sp. OTU4001 TaxID=3043854 RepID=UPI00313BC32C
MYPSKRKQLFGGGLLSALLFTGGILSASAQNADQAAGPDKAAAANADPDGLQAVVVTNRRPEGSQKVAGVVQSLTAEQLRRDGITDLRQLQVAVPGLNMANQEGNLEIYIRGVGSSNNTELGDPGAAPHLNGTYIPRPRGLGAMFYDLERVEVNKGPQGTLYGRNAMAGTLNIITQKPVIGETGGYLQGEVGNRKGHGLEGAFNIPLTSTMALRVAGYESKKDAGFKNMSTDAQASKLPPAGQEHNRAARLSLLYKPSNDLSVSLVGDTGKERGTGYPGSNIYRAVVTTGLRADDLDLRKQVYRGEAGELNNQLDGLQGKLNYDFGPVTMEFSASQREVDFLQRNASSEGVAYPGLDLSTVNYDNYSTVYWQTKSKSKIYEMRLASDTPSQFKWSSGLFHFKEDQQVGYLSTSDRGYCCFSGTEFTMPVVKGSSSAAYGDASYDFSEQLRVFGGVRYSEEKKYRYGIGGNWALTLGGENWDCCIGTRLGTPGFVPALLARPNFNLSEVTTPAQIAQFLLEGTKTPGERDTLVAQIQAIANGSNPNGTCFTRPDISNGKSCPTTNPGNTNGGFSYANLTIPTQQVGSSKDSFRDWRLGAEYNIDRNHLLYGKIATGHKSGGFNDSFNGSTIPETYRPEKLVSYELGSRNAFTLFGRHAILNATAFHYAYDSQVFQDLTCINMDTTQTPAQCKGYSLSNRNIGKSRIDGLETEAKFVLPNRFRLDLNVTLLDTKIKSGVVADARAVDYSNGGKSPLIDLAGNRLPLASTFNLASRITQSIDLGSGTLDWQALVNYRSSFFLTQFNERDIVFLDGKRQTALQAGFPDKQNGFATVNLGLGYTLDRYRFELWGSNVFNTEASQKALVGPSENIRFLNDARAYGMRMRYNFE